MRITKKDIENMVKRLNTIKGFEVPEWNTVGSFRLYHSGYGLSLQKIHNANGGVETVGNVGGMTTEEMYFFLTGLLAGQYV